MAPTETEVREPAPSTYAQRGGWSFIPLLRRIHFYAGILVAPFLVVAALTGLLYAVTPQLEELAYGDQFTANDTGERHMALADQVAAAQRVVPGGAITTVVPADAESAVTRVVIGDARTVLVDPVTGSVNAVQPWSGDSPLVTWFRDLHGNLHLGEPGALYIELAASWLWVLALAGFALWWHRRRCRGVSRAARTARAGIRRTRSWHAAVGAWILLGLLAISASGLTWSANAGQRFDLLLETLGGEMLGVDTVLLGAGAAGTPSASDARASQFDVVLAAARGHGLEGPVEITPASGAAWTVAQSGNTWPVHRDAVAVDPATGTITDVVRWADQPMLAKLSVLGINAHMGVLFGPLNQLVLAAVAIGLLVVIFGGYRMWWQRRPTRVDRRRPVGRPPPRGGVGRLPALVVGGAALAVAAIGWTLPLLGVSLLAFLAIDATAALIRQVRQ